MASAAFRVVIVRFDENRRDELVAEIGAELDISRAEASDLLRTLPLTVARGLTEDDADDLAELLEEQGAKVRIVEVSDRRGRPGRPGPREEPEEDEDEPWDDEDEDEERPRPRGRSRRSSQAILIGGGIVAMVLVAAVVVMAATGVDLGSLSCGGGYRGPGANQQLARSLDILANRFAKGFRPDDSPAHGTLSGREVVKLRERVEGPACFVWIGLSQQGSDLDLHLRRGGTKITEDIGEDNYPVVRHCVQSAEAAVLDLEVEMYSGTSDWVVQRYVSRGQPGTDTLEQTHALYAGQLIVNAEPATELRRVKQLNAGEDRSIPVQLEAQYCYVVLAVSKEGTDLDAAMENPRGLKIAEDNAVDNYPLLRDICPTESGEYRLHLTMYTGTSEVVYRIYRGRSGGAPAPDAAPPTPAPDAAPAP